MKKKYVFHQLVKLDRGPVNTCISDFLSGDIFQVPNRLSERFEQGAYPEIPGFIESLKEAKLIIQVDENAWIPPIYDEEKEEKKSKEVSLLVEVEEGVDIDSLLVFFESKRVHINSVHFFSESGGPDDTIHGVPVKRLKKDFSICKSLSTVTGDFTNINERTYYHYKKFNPCWGSKLAIKKDLWVRPCIYSELILGNISEPEKLNWEELWSKADQCRRITKSQVERCKDCEFKFVCFDCREIARVREGDLFAKNPNCPYDPKTGTGFQG